MSVRIYIYMRVCRIILREMVTKYITLGAGDDFKIKRGGVNCCFYIYIFI